MKQTYTTEESGLISSSAHTGAGIDTADKNFNNITNSSSNISATNTEKSSINDDLFREISASCSHIQSQQLHSLATHINILKKNIIDCTDLSKCKICCDLCEKKQLSDLYLCLDCVYMGSIKDNHWSHHAAMSGHYLCMNLKSSRVVCISCLNEASTSGDSSHKITNTRLDCVEDCSLIRKNFVDKLIGQFFQNYSFDSHTTNQEGESMDTSIPCSPFVTVNKPPIGIINIGNSCFLNCILQILLATPPLSNYFLSGFHNCSRIKDNCITCGLTLIFHYVITNESNGKLNVENLIRSLYTNGDNKLLTIAQQDAHEYFILIIEKLRNEIYGFNCPANLINGDCSYSSCVNNSKNSYLSNTTSNMSCSIPSYNMDSFDYISHVFQGSYSQKVFCLSCKLVDVKSRPVYASLCILYILFNPEKNSNNGNHATKKENAVNLCDCIKTFVEEEIMCNGSTTYCQECDSQQRFTFGDGVQKLDVKIDFPFHLDLKKFTDASSEHFYNDESDIKACADIEKNGGTKYTLYGVVVHKGSYYSGHYLSYVRINQQWYLCDDENIQPVTFETVSQCEWYFCCKIFF